ncbi:MULTISPECIES: DeoR/GlpR family DNA-binding transcription regulator [Sinorhizobium]|uniref:DeoR/GlpR family DNA-binding transcription regulator n=1 Tax=Sinorhizobium TaxID=28105 RepID=UPI0004B6BDAE|nr:MULTISPECIES: DeoR/GlpR family DNA-binding transcription regulator [Sinorhizobium]ASY60663.1 Glycerol-3-phosphate regulon repressor GlpR [Sinorhizobium sp. CCBAU 05631]ASY74163.1 Glycerol-3-phosphate regulon repressor GlpR [Sinorhizobium fredii CCBAU 83666]
MTIPNINEHGENIAETEAQDQGTSQNSSGRHLQTARQRALLAMVKSREFITVAEMAARFGVSEMTIRRDLKALEKDGSLERAHGGAVLPEAAPLGAEQPFRDRQVRNLDEKRKIVSAAARLIRQHETIGLDVGTTTLMLAKEIVGFPNLRAATNSLRVAMTLADSLVPVFVPTGQVRPLEMSITGVRAVRELANYRFDKTFLGLSAIDETGLYDFSIEDTEVKQAFVAQSNQVIALIDSSKFAKTSTVRLGGLDMLDVLVTDAAPPPALARALKDAKVELVIAGD